jgi:hypothetical protein
MGLEDNKARVHIELNKDPKTIEEAVQEVTIEQDLVILSTFINTKPIA